MIAILPGPLHLQNCLDKEDEIDFTRHRALVNPIFLTRPAEA